MSERERKVLEAMGLCYAGNPDYSYMTFATIAADSGIDLKHIRRTVRSLARKGWAEYGKGLCDEDGEFRGAGYRCTLDGFIEYRKLIEEEPPATPARRGGEERKG